MHVAAQPVVSQIVELHAVLGLDLGGGGRTAHLDGGMADRAGVGLRDFAGPLAVGQDHGDLGPGGGLQDQLRVGDPLPGSGVGLDAAVFFVVVVGHGVSAVGVDMYVAAQPVIGQLVELHAVLGADGSRRRPADLHIRMADSLGIGLGDLTGPLAVGQGHGDLGPGGGFQHDLGVGNALPGAGVGLDAVVFSAVVIGDAVAAVGIDADVAAQPVIGQVVELHAVLGADLPAGPGGLGGGGFRRGGGVRGFGACLGVRGSAGLFRLLHKEEPGQQQGNGKHRNHDQHAQPAELLPLERGTLEQKENDCAQGQTVQQTHQQIPVGGGVGLHLNGGGIGLGVEDVVAGGAHGVLRRVGGAVDAGAHETEHHVVAGPDGQVRIHPGGVGHGGVGNHHADEAPFTAQHVGQQGPGAAGPGGAQVGVAGHDGGGMALLDRQLKGPEVELPHGLLIAPDGEGEAVGLLVVQGEVLGVAVDALGGRAPNLGRA